MGRKQKTSRPSFFKVLIKDDYTTRLRLPHVFVQKYGEFLRESAKLRTSLGKITWDVKLVEEEINEDDDGKYWCFTGEGWTKFVKDLEIKFGEFLVFWFNLGNSITFDVSVYGTNCFEREVSAMTVDSDADHQDFEFSNDCHNVPDVIKKRRSKAGNDGGTSKLDQPLEETNPVLYFEILLKSHHRSRVSLRKRFCMGAGLMEAKTVGLEYVPKHCYQSVELDLRPNSYDRVDMASGWSEFRKANGLVLGKTYSFEFKPSMNVIQVNEVKERN